MPGKELERPHSSECRPIVVNSGLFSVRQFVRVARFMRGCKNVFTCAADPERRAWQLTVFVNSWK